MPSKNEFPWDFEQQTIEYKENSEKYRESVKLIVFRAL